MTGITAGMVKELRTRSGAGMMDCKAALAETNGDLEAAIDWLRKKGLSAAAKKSGRVASEGLVGVRVDGDKVSMVEVNSETDFVSRNDVFQGFVEDVVQQGIQVNTLEELTASKFKGEDTVEQALTNLIATIGENMSIRRFSSYKVDNGFIASYIHNEVKPGLGKIGVWVAFETDANKDDLQALAKQVAMHIAASNPLSLTPDDLSPEVVERERQIFAEQAKASGKPDNIIEKMVEGRVKKFFKESVLLEQVFVIDGETPVGKVVENKAKELGSNVKVAAFQRFELGEGVEKEEKDFASEVAEQLAS